MQSAPDDLNFETLRDAYGSGVHPRNLIEAILDRIKGYQDQAVFITLLEMEQLEEAIEALLARAPRPNSLPLWGIPFAVKDNIDVAGLPTTAGCAEFAYTAESSATVVDKLVEAGAILVGKTNLDQFATGLNGTRSPYGSPRSVFDHTYISGGSSSGSAVAVAADLVAFSLGTDTAGSGRVPAALNNIVGIKPTPGRVSTSGVVPACRSIDVVTTFANTVSDGLEVQNVIEAHDPTDVYSEPLQTAKLADRPIIGIPTSDTLEFFGNAENQKIFEQTIERAKGLGAEIIQIDYEPFRKAAEMLYFGPWVAERLFATENLMKEQPEAINSAVRQILENAERISGLDVFKGMYEFRRLEKICKAQMTKCDALLLPTTPTSYTVDEMMEKPIELNSNLGYYTNFANLMKRSVVSVPAGFAPNGLPFGVQLVADSHADQAICAFAARLHHASGTGSGRTRTATQSSSISSKQTPSIQIAVVGAHLREMPLNHELTQRGARFIREDKTASNYRLFELKGTTPPKPGLVRDQDYSGDGIRLEVWSLSPDQFGDFVANIPQPLGIGKVMLSDRTSINGFICEPVGLLDAKDITQFGGWKSYQMSRQE